MTYGMGKDLTGIGRYAQELTYALRDLGDNIEPVLLNPYRESRLPWYRNFETHIVAGLRSLPGVVLCGSVQIERAARSLRLDIVHDPCGIAPFLVPRSRARRLVTVHDAIPIVHPEVQPRATRAVFRTLVPASRWTADAVVTVSRSAQNDLIKYLKLPPGLVHVIPPGVHAPSDLELVEWRSRSEPVLARLGISSPYFLYVGAANPRKNLNRLCDAFRLVHARYPAASLVLAGPASGQVAAEGLPVRTLGYVPEDVLHILYAGALGFVYPSLYEGFGLPPLEAMAHGVPVVTSNVSSLPEVVGAAAIQVNPRDVDAISGAMVELLRGPAMARRLADEGRVRARSWTWARTALQMSRLYRQLIADAARN